MDNRERTHLINSFERSIPHAENGLISVSVDAAKEIIALLKEQEKTGHWIEKTDYNGDTYYDCSVCNESWMTIEGTPWVNGMNYCPHCGARMKGR